MPDDATAVALLGVQDLSCRSALIVWLPMTRRRSWRSIDWAVVDLPPSGLTSLLHIFESSNVSSVKIDVSDTTINPLEAKADEVALMLAAMANPKRLLVMCTLLAGEKSVGDLAAIAELTPAALSQHLFKMRALRLVSTRRDGQTIFYSLASREVQAVLATLYRVYCTPDDCVAG